tara:strand:+ start:749 stop:1420 length:672 start_codon:yes stop_codon:yes gene_type:complete
MQSINPDIFNFYTELKSNNNREWFEYQKPRYKALESEIKNFNDDIKEELNRNDEIERVKMFRIYRDIRFSKNKTPFKTHFGISFHRKKPQLRGGYYLNISPGDTFIATGFWNPEKEDLFRIRKEMEIDSDDFRKLIAEISFKKYWGSLTGDEVKTAPKGFSKEDPNIDLIKKKQYIFIKKFDDKSVLSPDFKNQIISHFIAIRPFFNYMTSILTTDLNGVPVF